MEKEIMTVQEAAEYLVLHPETVRLWARQGRLKGMKIGRDWRFRKADLDQWLIQHGEEDLKDK